MAKQKYYTWNHIGELAGKRLLNNDEKIAVCRKINATAHKPSTAAAIAV